VVIVNDREDTIHDSMITLDKSYGNAKEDMKKCVCNEMNLRFDECTDWCFAGKFLASLRWPAWKFGWIWKVWFQDIFAIGCTKLASPGANIIPEQFSISVRNHDRKIMAL
jgi:hypothetical protein